MGYKSARPDFTSEPRLNQLDVLVTVNRSNDFFHVSINKLDTVRCIKVQDIIAQKEQIDWKKVTGLGKGYEVNNVRDKHLTSAVIEEDDLGCVDVVSVIHPY